MDGIPERVKYTAYKFTPWGIQDDVDSTPCFIKDIYADKNESSDDDSSDGSPATTDTLY